MYVVLQSFSIALKILLTQRSRLIDSLLLCFGGVFCFLPSGPKAFSLRLVFLIHPKITSLSYGFEIFLENLVIFKSSNKQNKDSLSISDYQKSERDFAFLVNKDTKSQMLVDAIKNTDSSLIKNIKIFDVYEGKNIPTNKKSIALKVTIQSDKKTLNDNDLISISARIVKSVEEKTGAKLRS